MRAYKVFYDWRSIIIMAESLYAAKLEAIKRFNVPKSRQCLLAVVLADAPIAPDSIG
jgi:hypothetical protein